jgi:hypothetical protein
MIPIMLSVCSGITTVVTSQWLTQWCYWVIGVKVASVGCSVNSADGGWVHLAWTPCDCLIRRCIWHYTLCSTDKALQQSTLRRFVHGVHYWAHQTPNWILVQYWVWFPVWAPYRPILSRLGCCGKLLGLVTVGVPWWCTGKGQIPRRNNQTMPGVGTRMASLYSHGI